MKIVQITAGTGNFHCGNCVRDNALVSELQKLGHEALMVPLYLPMVTDEPAPTPHVPLFYGGINVYLQQKSALFRWTPRWLDALLDSDRLLHWAADHSGMTRAKDLGEITLSTLRGEEGRQVKELERLIEWLREYGRPDAVMVSNALLAGIGSAIRRALDVPVICTLQGEDGFLDTLVAPYSDEAWKTLADRARDIDAFIAVSRYYGGLMSGRLNLPDGKVHVVHNGSGLVGAGLEHIEPEFPTIGYLARLCRDKGLETLVNAFIDLKRAGRAKNLQLRVAGAMTPSDQPFVNRLCEKLSAHDLLGDVEVHPNISLEEKVEFLRGLTVLSVPATYGEAFGLYVIEALAVGTPVVQPYHAAFPEVLELAKGGTLYDPSRPGGLTEALEELLMDRARARSLGEAGRRAVEEHFTLRRMAEGVAAVAEKVLMA